MASGSSNALKPIAGDDADMDDSWAACCWICLASASPQSPLGTPCACPRPVHATCLARWQLQQAGRPEEHACRFCGEPYGDWRQQLGAVEGGGLGEAAHPVMAVNVRGKVHKIKVTPGPEGKLLFRQQVSEWVRAAALGGWGVGVSADLGGGFV